MKLFKVLFFLFSFSSVLFAADSMSEKLTFGLEISPAYTWLNTDNGQVDSDGGKIKLNGGLNIFYNVQERAAFYTGVHLNGYGGVLKGETGIITDVVEYNFREVEIPLGLKLRTGNFDKYRFTAQLGAGMGILYNSSASKNQGLYTYDNERFDYKLFPIRALYNLSIGAEYDLKGAVLTARINYKGWFSNIYFYDKGVGYPARNLDLILPDETINTYSRNIVFQPSALELLVGIMF